MITQQEIMKGDTLPSGLEDNYDKLFERINKFRAAYGKPMRVTSGYRSLNDHIRIYSEKGINNPPMGSLHLKCLAIDILDRDCMLKHFIVNNIRLVEEIGLWFEDFSVTPNWVHFQVEPPKSYKRFFLP